MEDLFFILNSKRFLPLSVAFVFIYGLLFGSFLNVCIYRIPIGKSIVFPPSSCTKCGHKITWYENIPVFSWFFLRGKCSGCGEKISLIYPVIELLNAVLYLFAFLKFGLHPRLILSHTSAGDGHDRKIIDEPAVTVLEEPKLIQRHLLP